MSLKKYLAIIILLAFFTASTLLVCFSVTQNAISEFSSATQANLNLNNGAEPIKVSFFNNIRERIKSENYSFTSEATPVKIKNCEIVPTYTTFSYFDILKISLEGLGFTENDQLELKEKVIISDTLALKLYFNTDAVGEILELNGRTYIVCGIYHDPKNLMSSFSKDGKDRVYIPYTLADSPENLDLHTIIYDTYSSTGAVIEQMNVPQYHFTSFAEKTQVIKCINRIWFFFLYAGLGAVVLYFWRIILKLLIKGIGENLKVNYFFKSLISIPLKYLSFVIMGAGIPALLIFVFLKWDFSIYIVPKYIPFDNIFDVSHYLGELLKNSQGQNTLALTGDTFRLKLYNTAFSASLWLSLVFLIFYTALLVSLFSGFKTYLKNPEE